MELRLLINILAICSAGLFAGVMLNIGLTLGSYWKSLPPAEFMAWFRDNSHFIARTIPFVAVPALIGVVGSLWMGWENHSSRYYWGGALACLLGIAVITFTYHLPTNARFSAGTIPLQETADVLNQWLMLHAVRISLGILSVILGVLAVSK